MKYYDLFHLNQFVPIIINQNSFKNGKESFNGLIKFVFR